LPIHRPITHHTKVKKEKNLSSLWAMLYWRLKGYAYMHNEELVDEYFHLPTQKLLTNMHLFAYKVVNLGETRYKLRLKARNEFKILKKLAKLGHANVYEISKSLKDAGHYSTILRALRRMERKGLVRAIIGDHADDRGQKTYEVTLLGKAIISLAEGDWKRAAEKIAEQSSKFRDCQRMYQVLGYDYYEYLTYYVIESLMYPKTSRDLDAERKQVDEEVTQRSGRWIRKNIMPKLNVRETRSEGLRQIEQLMDIPWMRPILIQFIEEYVSEMKDWLRTVEYINLLH
jgi:DNA-binding PadR family transcriptional regulator